MPWNPSFFRGLSLIKTRLIDLTGNEFGKLTVAWPAGRGNKGQIYWLCFCVCGSATVVRGVLLRAGKVDRCPHEARVKARTKHGHSPNEGRSPEYQTWDGMIQRCTNPQSIRWNRYGGRGIKVCKRWFQFESFLADMGCKPFPKRRYSLDRVNNDGDYEPTNCRWATLAEQNRDRTRDNKGRFQ